MTRAHDRQPEHAAPATVHVVHEDPQRLVQVGGGALSGQIYKRLTRHCEKTNLRCELSAPPPCRATTTRRRDDGSKMSSQEALWRVVDEVAENVGTLSEPDAEALRGPAEKIQRLRDLHSSCLPHERQLRATHLALLTEHYLCSDKLLQLRRYCAVNLQDPALPEADRQFLLSLQQLTASLDKPSADAPQSA